MTPQTISLDGEWEFYYNARPFTPGADALPDRNLFTGRMVTPGYWDDHYELFDEEDFFSLPARFNPDYRKIHFPMGATLLPHASSSFLIGTGCYRKQVVIDLHDGGHAFLKVGPAMWGCAVYCNGRLAGRATGYSTASEFEITDLAASGRLNEIILVVCNVRDDGGAFCRPDGTHAGTAFGARPTQHRGLAAQGYQSERGGIGGETFIRITGSGALTDAWLTFENGAPRWHAETAGGAGRTLRWTLLDGEKIFDSGVCVCSGDSTDFTTEKIPLPWSDREPRLYRARLELTDGDELLDRIEFPWGARVLSCTDSRIMINGEVTYFRGVTEHCYFPETCNPHFDRGKYLRDLGVLRQAGFNFIRCHTWCPPEPFYEACDRLGMLVQTELPSVYSFEEAAAIIRMIRRHPCAVILCEGNEKLINDDALVRLRKLAAMLREMAPGMLFNPQEAMRFVEYDFGPGRVVTPDPVPHDAARLAEVAEFSDVYGSLGGGHFSYAHDLFPGPERADFEHSHYRKPCLSHEIGILGGYLDFDLEERYRGTFIGTGLFEAAREYMEKNHVYQNRRRYYRNNCRFISLLRKQLIENIRSCSAITGYDYLGGIDTHWHMMGYPCGVFNEFYEEKYGESAADVRRYNAESVLLCSALRFRNRTGGTRFAEKLRISYFGRGAGAIDGEWIFEGDRGVAARGKFSRDGIAPGTVSELCEVNFTLPVSEAGERYTLRVAGILNSRYVENHWSFWVFPDAVRTPSASCRVSDRLTPELIDFAAAGGGLLLTGGFPAETREETFRPHTSGRALGHSGALINPHPVWRRFPHEEFMDWQFFPLMNGSRSISCDREMPEYRPLMELIPSFKLIRFKSMLSEFRVGRGRIIMTGLVLADDEPAGRFLKHELLSYLDGGAFADAPEWSVTDLKQRLNRDWAVRKREIALDAGGRPLSLSK